MGGVKVHHCIRQRVPPLKVFLPTHGPLCWSQSRSSDWGQKTVWNIDMGLHPSLPHMGSNPSLGTDTRGNKGQQEWDEVLAEEGIKTSPHPGQDSAPGQGAAGPHPHGICFHRLLSTLLAAALAVPDSISAPSTSPSGLAGGVMRSTLTSPQAAFIPVQLPPPLPTRAPRGWQENNSEEDE